MKTWKGPSAGVDNGHWHRRLEAAGLAILALTCTVAAADARERELDFRDLRPVESGHRGYYELRRDDRGIYVHARYKVGDDATKLALVLPDADRQGRHQLTWRWRALVLPAGGDECNPRKTDSAASVYVAWRRGLRWYGLKYSWSTASRVGAVCDARNSPFLRGETIILRSSAPLDTWLSESIDLEAEFHKHFTPDDPAANVPDLVGIAVLTDGDQTRSESSADFGSFILTSTP